MKFAAALAAVAWFAASAPAAALDLPPEPGPQRTVAIFDHFCLGPMPALDRVAAQAEALDFLELEGDELDSYRPEAPVDEFRAWAFQDSDTPYVLTISRGQPDEPFRQAVPAFADAASTACSLVLGDGEDEADLLPALSRWLGRNPDRRWEQPPVQIYAWTAGTSTLLHQIQFLTPLEGEAGGVLNFTVLRKE